MRYPYYLIKAMLDYIYIVFILMYVVLNVQKTQDPCNLYK